jgi:hypothetical protein
LRKTLEKKYKLRILVNCSLTGIFANTTARDLGVRSKFKGRRAEKNRIVGGVASVYE